MLKCLKPGGRLIIGVPNNDSYIRRNKMYNKVLNMPPHHVGLWTLDSLKSLEGILPVKLEETFYEPLVDGNVTAYTWTKVNALCLDVEIFTRVIWRVAGDRVLVPIVSRFSDRIRGNSMLAVFTRRAT